MSPSRQPTALGLIETPFLSTTLMVADRVLQEAPLLFLGIDSSGDKELVIRVRGETGAVESALREAELYAEHLGSPIQTDFIARPADDMEPMVAYPQAISDILESRTQFIAPASTGGQRKTSMKSNQPAIGIIETQGLTALLEATDVMLKAADVTVLGKDKIGAAYVTVIVTGDVAAVKAAVDAATEAVAKTGLGKLVAAHVIARPHDDLRVIMPGG